MGVHQIEKYDTYAKRVQRHNYFNSITHTWRLKQHQKLRVLRLITQTTTTITRSDSWIIQGAYIWWNQFFVGWEWSCLKVRRTAADMQIQNQLLCQPGVMKSRRPNFIHERESFVLISVMHSNWRCCLFFFWQTPHLISIYWLMIVFGTTFSKEIMF